MPHVPQSPPPAADCAPVCPERPLSMLCRRLQARRMLKRGLHPGCTAEQPRLRVMLTCCDLCPAEGAWPEEEWAPPSSQWQMLWPDCQVAGGRPSPLFSLTTNRTHH